MLFRSARLLPLHVRGTRISRTRFAAMLTDPTLAAAAARSVGCVVETMPAAGGETTSLAATLESAAWTRFQQLANRAFRRSHLGLGAVVGYIVLRQVEIANLITLSEGLRASTARAALRARLIPCAREEHRHV